MLGLFILPVQAKVIELEGTIKSIDPDAMAITIVRKTPKGEKVLELEIAKNAGDVSGFKEGDKIGLLATLTRRSSRSLRRR